MAGKIQLQSLCLAILLLTACSRHEPMPLPDGTSWGSELVRSLDLTRLTKPTEPWERSAHFSSSATPHKTSLVHLAPEIFGDMDHGFFLRVEEHATCVDAVLAETGGAGMISWIWSANPTGEMLLYIDDPDTPALIMPFKDFIHGKFLPVRYPFAAVTAGGHNLHFPIIHSTYLKMVLRVRDKKQLASFYYQIAWNALDGTAPVHPFNPEPIRRQKPLLRQIAKQMLNPANTPSSTRNIVIPSGGSAVIFHTETSGVIRHLQIEARSKKAFPALRIQAFWDGALQPAIDCPLHLLAGVSPDFENAASFPATVDGTRLSIHWLMPFSPGSRIVLINEGLKDVMLTADITVYPEIPKALRLHAKCTRFQGLKTDAPNILTLAEISGGGRIAGCTINVNSRTDQWWGEGDQIIFLDDLNNPVWRGTGTEDYFGFAWCSTKEFDHPLRGQSLAVRRTKDRKTVMHRYHLIDTLPFHTAAKFQTEAWGLTSGTMDYDSLILYYAAD